MVDNLSIAVHTFTSRSLMPFSDETDTGCSQEGQLEVIEMNGEKESGKPMLAARYDYND